MNKSLTVIAATLAVALFAFAPAAFSQDLCKDILVNGAMQRTELRSHIFFHQILATEYAQKNESETDENLSHDGTMAWAGIVFGGKFNKNDVKRYFNELRSKLDLSTVLNQQSSVLLATGDPKIVQAWSDCITRKGGGLSMRFEAKTPTAALLHLEWYAYPVAPGVSSDTELSEDVAIPSEKNVTIISGADCLKKGKVLRDKISCTVNLGLPDGKTDLLLSFNATHGSASAYLPQRRILIPQREQWKPQPGEEGTIGVYAYEHATRSKSVCVSPKKDWSFVEATMEAKPQFIDGWSSRSRCMGEIKPLSTSFLCFNAFMAPDVSSDNKCAATLVGETIHWEPVDGLGLGGGLLLNTVGSFSFTVQKKE